NDGIYRGTDTNRSGGSDPATTVFVKGARYDKMIEGFGGVGVNATTPDELRRAVNAAMDSRKPTLINAVIDPAAGSESGRIGNLNPQSALRKKWRKATCIVADAAEHRHRGEELMAKRKKAAKAKSKAAKAKTAAKRSSKKVVTLKVKKRAANRANGLPRP